MTGLSAQGLPLVCSDWICCTSMCGHLGYAFCVRATGFLSVILCVQPTHTRACTAGAHKRAHDNSKSMLCEPLSPNRPVNIHGRRRGRYDDAAAADDDVRIVTTTRVRRRRHTTAHTKNDDHTQCHRLHTHTQCKYGYSSSV